MRIFLCSLTLWLVGCGENPRPTAAKQTTDFQVISQGEVVDFEPYLEADRLTVFDFYADWCAPCKKLDKSLAALKDVYGDRLEVYKLDLVDWQSELAKHHKIKDLPYLIVYDEQKQLWRQGPSNTVLSELVKNLNQPKK